MNQSCLHCGASFEANPSANRKYCSLPCNYEAKKDRVSKECEVCGDTFEVRSSKADKRRTCSKECQYERSRVRVSVTCERCDEPFEVKPHREGTAQFCSWECRASGVTVISKSCDYCGEPFETPPCEAHRRKCCSKRCAALNKEWTGENHPNWKGFAPSRYDYGPAWPRQRRLARERDFYQCRCCGMTQSDHKATYGKGLQVHHRTPYTQFDSDEEAHRLTNLITLCAYCHPKLESEISPSVASS